MIKGNKIWEKVNLRLFEQRAYLATGVPLFLILSFKLYHVNTDKSYFLIFLFLKHHELLTCVVLCKIPVRQLGFDSPTERTEHKNRPLDN